MSFELNEDVYLDLLDADARASLAQMCTRLEEGGRGYLEVHFASLPRKLGRDFLNSPNDLGSSAVRLASMRSCDLGAAVLLRRYVQDHGSALLVDLYNQGDALERRMILKALSFIPVDDVTVGLLQEAHRTNDEELFKAAFADTDLPARALNDNDYNRAVLKCAFMGLDYKRLVNAASRASEELSDMLLQFISEREAAGRKPWPGSLELAAHAPCHGVLARVAGDLQHGDDERRFHAVRGAGILIQQGDEFLVKELTAQQSRERSPEIKAEIDRILGQK